MQNKNKKTNKKGKKPVYPDPLQEILDAVIDMDKKKSEGLDIANDHKKVVKAINLLNNIQGKGYISISKARKLLQAQATKKKTEAEDRKEELKRAVQT